MADDNWLNNSRAPTRQIGFNDMNLKRLFLQSITSWYERFLPLQNWQVNHWICNAATFIYSLYNFSYKLPK